MYGCRFEQHLIGCFHFSTDQNSPLHEAVLEDNIVNVRKLIEKGVDMDAKNYFGKTPLLLACQRGYDNLVRLFVESNAEIGAKDNYNKNCLHFAAHNGITQKSFRQKTKIA